MEGSGDMNKTLGNFGGSWPLIVAGKTWNLNYPDENTISRFIVRCKKLGAEALDMLRKFMSADGFAVACSVLGAEMGVKRLYEWGGPRCMDSLLNTDGLSYFLLMMLKPNHPTLTEAEAGEIVAASLAERPGNVDEDGNAIENPYLLKTILELADQGKLKPPKTGAAA